ncbi:MAG: flavodoxin domain-containing protein [Bacteroidota bacterium]
MLTETKLKTFLDLVASASKEELIWLNGYLNGVVAQQTKPVTVPAKGGVEKLTIVYGTETGNSKKLATDFAHKVKQKGILPKVIGLDQYRLTDLPKEEYLLAVISTQGEGDPPDAAKKFYDHIHNNGFKLDKLKYSVLALGDTSYPLYCKAGEDVDNQLNKLGGKRIAPIQKCDVDYDEDANSWFDSVLKQLSSEERKTEAVVVVPAPAKPAGKKIYTGTVISNINLNDRGSNKETHHIEIAAEGVIYQCGDSIGVVPENPLLIVEAIIALTGVDPVKKLEHKKDQYTVFDLLHKKLSIIYLTTRLVKEYGKIVGQEIPDTRMDLLDLLKIYPVKDTAQFEQVLNILNGISPRLYTIASSPAAHDGEVHITIARDEYTIGGQKRFGLCSDYLNAFPENAHVNFFVQANKHFRLPAPEKDTIMIGPGTGIAGFRSFLAERDATGAAGRNWLFFGEQHFASDFLYQTEIQNWYETGVLTKVNLAFSRDQKEKIYVQHKMLEHAEALFDWIKSGAYIYICGKKDPMSVDVENTILHIIEQHGKLSKEEAKAYLEKMKDEGRYEKDVY